MWNKFHEGWKGKRGEEVAEKWWRNGPAADVDRSSVSVDRSTNESSAILREGKERGKGK